MRRNGPAIQPRRAAGEQGFLAAAVNGGYERPWVSDITWVDSYTPKRILFETNNLAEVAHTLLGAIPAMTLADALGTPNVMPFMDMVRRVADHIDQVRKDDAERRLKEHERRKASNPALARLAKE